MSRLHNFKSDGQFFRISSKKYNIPKENEFCGRLCVGSISTCDYFLSLQRHQQLRKVKKKKIGTRNFITCDSVAFRILLLAGSLGSRSGTAFEPYPIRFVTSYQAEDRNKESWRVMVMSIRDLTTVVSVQ